jgi:glucosamine-6-phosphate deaminase
MLKLPPQMKYRVFETPESACVQVAAEMALLIRERAILSRTAVFGLTTGKSTIPLYQELVYLHREERLSFKNVITFNLDEYLGLEAAHPSSSRSFMQRELFDHLDLPPQNIHFLSGLTSDHDAPAFCSAYEHQIVAAGGIDYQILGIGRNGHIGFNEPGTPIDARTRMVELHESTRSSMARKFGGIENVPTQALTMGCGTILEARRVALLAWGARKNRVVKRAMNEPIPSKTCASYLQTHPSVRVYLDIPAGLVLGR